MNNKFLIFFGFLLVLISVSFAEAEIIPYWIQDDNVSLWIKTNVTAGNTKDIYIYMNWENGTLSNIDEVALFGDDFNDGSVNWSKWASSSQSSYTEENGNLKMAAVSVSNRIYSYYQNSSKDITCIISANQTETEHYYEFAAFSRGSSSTGHPWWDERASISKAYLVMDILNNKYFEYSYTNPSERHRVRYTILNNNTGIMKVYNALSNQLIAQYSETAANTSIKIGMFKFTSGFAYVDYVFCVKYSPAEITITCENIEQGNFLVYGGTATARRKCSITSNETLTDFQFEIPLSYFNNDSKLIITNETQTTNTTIEIYSPIQDSIHFYNSVNFSFIPKSFANQTNVECWENLTNTTTYLGWIPTEQTYNYSKNVYGENQTLQYICFDNSTNSNITSSLISFKIAVYNLTSCQIINQPGRYILQNDIYFEASGGGSATTTGCFNITSNDVIFEGNNKTLTIKNIGGTGTYTTGIKISSSNVTFNELSFNFSIPYTYRYEIGLATTTTQNSLSFNNIMFYYINSTNVGNIYGIYLASYTYTNFVFNKTTFYNMGYDVYGGTKSNWTAENIYDCEVSNRYFTSNFTCLTKHNADLESRTINSYLTLSNVLSVQSYSLIRNDIIDKDSLNYISPNLFYQTIPKILSEDTTYTDYVLFDLTYDNNASMKVIGKITTSYYNFEVSDVSNDVRKKFITLYLKNEKTQEAITSNLGGTCFLKENPEVFSYFSFSGISSRALTRYPSNITYAIYCILYPGFNTSIYAPRTEFMITKNLSANTVYNETITLFALENQYAYTTLICLYPAEENYYVIPKKFYASEGIAKRVASGQFNSEGKTYLILDTVQQLYAWEVYDDEGNLVYSDISLGQIIPSQTGCSHTINIHENKTLENLTAKGKFCSCRMVGNITSECTCRALGNIDFKWNLTVKDRNGTVLYNQISYITPTTFYNIYNETVYITISNDESLFRFVHVPINQETGFSEIYFFYGVSALSILMAIPFMPFGAIFPIGIAIVGYGNGLLPLPHTLAIIGMALAVALGSSISNIRKIGEKR